MRGPIPVSLVKFLASGRYGPVEVGQTRAQVEKLLGPPDEWGCLSRRSTIPGVWKYGNVEIHFHPRQGADDSVVLIHLEDFEVPDGGLRVQLDPWFVRKGLSVPQVERELAIAEIDCTRHALPHLPHVAILLAGPGAALWFTDEADEHGSPTGLYAVSYPYRDWE